MWERLSRVFLDRLGEATRLTGSVHHSIRLPSRPKGRKIALNPTYKRKRAQAQPCFGPKGNPTTGRDDQRSERPRLHGLRRDHRRCKAHQSSEGQTEETSRENTQSLRGQRRAPTRPPSRAAPRVEPQLPRPLAAPQQQTSSAALEATTPSMDWEAATCFMAVVERTR